MRAAVLQVTLGILTLLLAFCKAQANENKTGDEQQYDVVLPYSCEEEVAMIESLLEDIGQKAREKDSAVLEMQEKFEQAQHSKEEQFNVTLAQRDKDISELQAKLVESEELLKIVPPLSVTLAQRDKDISELQAKLVESEELLNAMEAQLQPKESEIMELKHKSLDMESALGTLEDTMADLDTSLDILDALRDILMVDDDEKIVGRVKEILLASRVPLYEEKSDDHAGDSVPGEGSKAPPSEEVLEGQDELQRVKQELIDVKRWSSDEISHIESREHAFFFNVSELVHEMVACRTGEKDMGVLEGYREKTLDVLQKLSEEVKACHDIPDSLQTRHAEGEEEGTETKMGHDYECRNVSDYLMRDLTTCKEEVVSLSECIVSLKDENRVLLERPSEFLLNQTESLLSGLEALKVEHNEESQEVGENSMEVETRKRAAEIVKQLHDALIVGQKLAGLNSNLIATPLVEDVQDMEESSYSDKGIHAEPNEEERGRQEQIEMEVDFKGHISNETDSLLYRLAELEEELVACREKAELQNVHEDHPDIPHVEDEVVVTCANASVEDELYKPGKKTYTSPTPDYNSLSTFIDDALTIGASLASRGMGKYVYRYLCLHV